MHLFGVLLPVYWLTLEHCLAPLIPIFALGSIAMGAGTRIVIDIVIAGLLWLIASLNFKRRGATLAAVSGTAVDSIAGVCCVLSGPAPQQACERRSAQR